MKEIEQMTDDELNQFLIQEASAQPSEIDYNSLSDEELNNILIEDAASQMPQDRPADAFAQGMGNAAALGYLPQIQAATEPIIQGAMDFFAGDDTDEKLKEQGFQVGEAPAESYVQRRDRFIRRGQELAEENPVSHTLGGVTGAISSGIATGGGLSKLLGTAGKAASAGKRFGDAAKAGAAMGFARNPGDTEGEVSPLQLEDRAANAAKDAATGLVIQGGLEGIRSGAKAVKNAGGYLKTRSQRAALKASGANKTQMEKLIAEGGDESLGQAVLDNNLIKPGNNARDIANNAKAAMKESGERLGGIYKKADKSNSLALRRDDVKGIVDEYSQEAAERLSGTADGDEIAKKVNDVLETIPENPTFGQLMKWRKSIDRKINFAKQNKDLSEYQQELKNLRGKVQEKIADRMGTINPDLKKSFLKENKRFSELEKVKTFANKKAAGNESNTSFGIREGFGATLGGMAGTAVAGPIGAVPGMALGAVTTNFARKHATPFVAMTANKVARALEKNQKAIGKFSDPLIKAAENPEKFVAAINGMMKDPEFKKSINELNGGPVYRGPAKGKKK